MGGPEKPIEKRGNGGPREGRSRGSGKEWVGGGPKKAIEKRQNRGPQDGRGVVQKKAIEKIGNRGPRKGGEGTVSFFLSTATKKNNNGGRPVAARSSPTPPG